MRVGAPETQNKSQEMRCFYNMSPLKQIAGYNKIILENNFIMYRSIVLSRIQTLNYSVLLKRHAFAGFLFLRIPPKILHSQINI
jgi:hypothetical protein